MILVAILPIVVTTNHSIKLPCHQRHLPSNIVPFDKFIMYQTRNGFEKTQKDNIVFIFLAEELIRHWLAGVEFATSTSHGSEREEVTRTGFVSGESKNVEKEDFLSSVDWVSGDVGQSTKDVLRGLLSKELKCEVNHQTTTKKKSYNPLVTMEMRHNEVRLAVVWVVSLGTRVQVYIVLDLWSTYPLHALVSRSSHS